MTDNEKLDKRRYIKFTKKMDGYIKNALNVESNFTQYLLLLGLCVVQINAIAYTTG